MDAAPLDFPPRKGAGREEIAAVVDAILDEATLEEKVAMMSGHGFFEAYREDKVWGARPYRAGAGCERLGVPALWFTDGPRGVARGQSTCFPCTMARGASFDVDLERRIGEAMGIEVRAQGCNLSGAVCINLLRHPAWGRAQETYGEDPHHLGEMGAALGTGIQTHNVIATVKHFALNSMENARFKVDVRIDERTLHDVYLPHFRRVLEAGVASVMSAYNKVNGTYAGQNAELLTTILRDEWGFDGFVHSDWIKGVYDVQGAVAGLDIENPEPLVWGDKLVAAVKAGEISPDVVDRACRRILVTLYRFLCAPDPLPDYTPAMVASPSHRTLAREAAEKSAVLLTNTGVLPLDRARIGRLAVLGRLAAVENTGDMGSSRVRAPYVITPLEGLRALLGSDRILIGDETDLVAARAAVAQADAVVVVVGYTAKEEGEFIPGNIDLGQESAPQSGRREAIGGDRSSLDLPREQVDLIKAAAEAGKPLVVAIVAGSAVMVEDWIGDAGAILQTFYAGMEGGAALARLLFGGVSPSGRLPFTVARDAAHYPFFDRDADEIDYGGLHGYSKFADEQHEPRFPFGHGLTYAAFEYSDLRVRAALDGLEADVEVRNIGAVYAEEVVQLYIAFPHDAAHRAPWLLRGFQRVALEPDEARRVSFTVSKNKLSWRDPETRERRLTPGEYRIKFATNARAEGLSGAVRFQAHSVSAKR